MNNNASSTCSVTWKAKGQQLSCCFPQHAGRTHEAATGEGFVEPSIFGMRVDLFMATLLASLGAAGLTVGVKAAIFALLVSAVYLASFAVKLRAMKTVAAQRAQQPKMATQEIVGEGSD